MLRRLSRYPGDLFLAARRPRREPEVEIARLERVFVVAQRRIVGGHRHGKAGRQRAVQSPAPLSSSRPGRSVSASSPKCDRKPRGAIGERASRRLAPAARPDPAGFQQHVERALGGETPRMSSISARVTGW